MYPMAKARGFQEPYTRVGPNNTRMDLGAAITAGLLPLPEGNCPIRKESRPCSRRPVGSPDQSFPTPMAA